MVQLTTLYKVELVGVNFRLCVDVEVTFVVGVTQDKVQGTAVLFVDDTLNDQARDENDNVFQATIDVAVIATFTTGVIFVIVSQLVQE